VSSTRREPQQRIEPKDHSMLTAFLAASLVGCAPQPASIKLDGEPIVTVNALDTVPLKKADVLDKNGKVITPAPKITWTVTPEAVAKLEGEKAIKPLANGEATVVAMVGNIKSQYQLVVAVPDRIQIQGYTAGKPIAVGSVALLKADVMAGDKVVAGQQVTWKSSDDKVVTVANGKVTGVAVGTANVAATSGKLEGKIDIQVVEAVPGQPGDLTKTLKEVPKPQAKKEAGPMSAKKK
jgi:uncharacterized protein YjdB